MSLSEKFHRYAALSLSFLKVTYDSKIRYPLIEKRSFGEFAETFNYAHNKSKRLVEEVVKTDAEMPLPFHFSSNLIEGAVSLNVNPNDNSVSEFFDAVEWAIAKTRDEIDDPDNEYLYLVESQLGYSQQWHEKLSDELKQDIDIAPTRYSFRKPYQIAELAGTIVSHTMHKTMLQGISGMMMDMSAPMQPPPR